MNKVNAVMVGGLFDENGISAFARPVLFGTAGDAMRDALPDAVEACCFAHDDRSMKDRNRYISRRMFVLF